MDRRINFLPTFRYIEGGNTSFNKEEFERGKEEI